MPKDQDMNQANTAGPDIQTLLQTFASGGKPDALLKSMLGADSSPTTSMLASMLLSGLDDTEEAVEPDSQEAEIERLLALSERGDVDEAPQHSPDFEELEALREVNDTLAAALGACGECWGGDAHCAHCGGDGAPGAASPDPELFTHLILPAVRQINATRPAKPSLANKRNRNSTEEEKDNG